MMKPHYRASLLVICLGLTVLYLPQGLELLGHWPARPLLGSPPPPVEVGSAATALAPSPHPEPLPQPTSLPQPVLPQPVGPAGAGVPSGASSRDLTLGELFSKPSPALVSRGQ